MLKGNQIVLRPVKRVDISNFLIWFNDTEVTQYLGRNLPMTEMEEEKWVESLASDATKINFVIEILESGQAKPIGTTGFHNLDSRDRHCEFGIVIGDKGYWSNGYGSEAARLIMQYGFEQLNLNRISSNVYDFNERSQRLHLKVGFKQEGRRRQVRFINGAYRDVLEYGILCHEWKRHYRKEQAEGV
jgi:RimJ/RimL family protein N-acetyltransferase